VSNPENEGEFRMILMNLGKSLGFDSILATELAVHKLYWHTFFAFLRTSIQKRLRMTQPSSESSTTATNRKKFQSSAVCFSMFSPSSCSIDLMFLIRIPQQEKIPNLLLLHELEPLPER
jgi:hypothetical protein